MIFTIAVHGAPYGSNAHHHALRFAQAVLKGGHSIARIFFYHEAVHVALASIVPPQEERNLAAEWQTLGEDHDVELAVCIASGLKRGVIDDAETARYERPASTLASGFVLVGLGQLIDAAAHSDRYVEFPA